MTDLTTWALDNKGLLLAVLAGGGFAPFVAGLLEAVLRIPGVGFVATRLVTAAAGIVLGACKVVQGASYAWGATHSLLCIRLAGSRGQAVEDALQRFVEAYLMGPVEKVLPEVVFFLRWLLVAPYFRGMDADDVAGEVRNVARAAALELAPRAEKLAEDDEHDPAGEKERRGLLEAQVVELVQKRAVGAARKVGTDGAQAAARMAIRGLLKAGRKL